MTPPKVLASLALYFALTISAVAEDATQYRASALKGDYQAQRNWAYSLANGDGIAKNPIEGCVWRIVVIATQHARVGSSDASNLTTDCPTQTVMNAAQVRATAIMAKLPLRTRTIASDLSDLTEGKCPGPSCEREYGQFPGLYRRAVDGELAAMRELARCFAERCDKFPSFDLLHSCVWIRRVIASSSATPSRADSIRQATTCGFLEPRATLVADAMIAEIGRMKRD